MEVGAVKQAFNNEVIQLKRNLNQARIQIIHKLTRKAKTFVQKKTPEKLKEKLKRKAESAVNEVLILKKIKPRDIARFTVTHTGNLEDYLNKPIVDQDKACARLLLHKSLQEKYKAIRNRFSGIPIKDLLMSRNERLKLKRQAQLDQKMKKDKKKKVINAEGEWNVENINTSKTNDVKKITSKKIARSESDDDEEMPIDEQENSGDEVTNVKVANSDSEDAESDDQRDDDGDKSDAESTAEIESDQESDDNDKGENTNHEEVDDQEQSDSDKESNNQDDSENEEDEEESVNKRKPSKPIKSTPAKVTTQIKEKQTQNVSPALTFAQLGKNRRPEIKNPNKPKDIHKNKNLKEKLQSRKFKKDSNESQVKQTKMVDPFFITATGENYMSVAEPRLPDEIKEIHKQGNRKERRAAMFGHEPKIKPRQDFRENNSRQNNSSGSKTNQSDDGYRGNNGFRNRNDMHFRGKNDQFRGKADQNDRQFKGRNNQFKGQNDKPFGGRNDQFKGKNVRNDRSLEGRTDQFKGRNDSKFKGRNNDIGEPKVEKLHPSWEAKKKQSGILPFQGKKIVFDEG